MPARGPQSAPTATHGTSCPLAHTPRQAPRTHALTAPHGHLLIGWTLARTHGHGQRTDDTPTHTRVGQGHHGHAHAPHAPHMHTCAHACMHTCIPTHMWSCDCTHMHTHAHVHTCTHACMHTRMHALTHAHMCARTHAHMRATRDHTHALTLTLTRRTLAPSHAHARPAPRDATTRGRTGPRPPFARTGVMGDA